MKRTLLFLLFCALCATVVAQTIPPRFQGGDNLTHFHKRFEKIMTKVMLRDGYQIEELSKDVALIFTIDTLGRCLDPEFPLVYGGRTFSPSERTKELIAVCLSEIGILVPAQQDGVIVPFELHTDFDLTFLPDAVIAPSYQGKGRRSLQAMYNFVISKIQLHEEMLKSVFEVAVEFTVEKDGSVTLGRVLKSTDPRLTQQVQRALQKTSGKWTPGKEMGIPISITYTLPIYLHPKESPPETFEQKKLY